MAEPSTGSWITPVVRLTRPLRRGGMGAVWLAHHTTLETDVVVKFLASSYCSDKPSRERFAREATAAASVKSPHVVQTLDHGVTDEGVPFIVMEHLEGEDLGEVLQRGVLTPLQVASVVEQVARALDAAHKKGVIHRDVKPANIFLTDVGARDPFVKLLDFGVAKSMREHTLTASGELLGTPVYMSPEQITGEQFDARSDLWSLGIVAFRCLAGRRPFQAESVAAVAYQIVHTAMPAPSSLAPDIPPAVDSWFARSCAREPAKRFSSAREMANALWAALEITRTSNWSGATPAPSFLEPQAETVVEGRPSNQSLTNPPASLELTGGSLRSSVATVPIRPPSRIRSALLIGAIPVALVIGYAASELGSATPRGKETSTPASAPLDVPRAEPPRAPVTAASSASAAPSASAATSAATSSGATNKPVPRIYPRAPRPPRADPGVDPSDLGF